MEESPGIRLVAHRASQLFAAAALAGAFGFALTWLHHAWVTRACLDSPSSTEPATCSYRLWLFGMSWTGLVVFLLLLFCFCMLATWVWFLVRRKPG